MSEFIARKRLAKLGYTARDFDETPADRVEYLLMIDCEIDALRDKDAKDKG